MTHSLLINLSFLIPEPTGISVYASHILPALKPLKLLLLVSQEKPGYSCYSVPNNMTPDQGTKGHLRRLLWTQFKLPQIYQQLKGNLIFSPIPEAPLYCGCRSIVMAHDLIPLRFPRRGSRLTAYFKYYIPLVLSQAEHIVCNSISTAQDLVNFFDIPEQKITPIPLAYNPQRFQFLDLPTRNYFLYIGRHDAYKNLSRLINAFSKLKHLSEYELWFAGPTDETYTPELKKQVQDLELTQQVKFLNYVPFEQLIPMINQAIAVVFPSLWEGFGFPVLEAMACGTPVITSNLSSLPEVGGNAALYVNPYQVEEITEAMETLANNTEMRSHLRQLGLEQVKQFSWEKTGQKTAKVIQQYL
ncbi:Protein RfbU [Planktothrix tepida]|uniref:Glycosyl transferase, group 1 n=2 Tax=Planktothrix TaxID=54304 RepID=A0A1J1LE91_9CYAN|nr:MULTISPECIES: glycosyltransferase family 1 protein [Planktothrix]CAD5913065.1 Protein RfbU [Planktothrix tepida]CAD5986482.1 Protein RfbU [Planktothrix pseudagardhii]CUR30478.1 Glycosyl transferase, group 1 [Planktothrix tepida PCC 9214]